MTLAFPNSSRSFDEVRNAVRFMGHDGMFQIRFFIEAGALTRSDAAKREAGRVGSQMPVGFRRIAYLHLRCCAKSLLPRPPRFLHADRRRFPVTSQDADPLWL